VPATALEKLKTILSEKLSEEEVQALMTELTIAFGDGSVAISGDATGAVTLTGNKNIVGDNNRVVINQGIDLKELIDILCRLIPNIPLPYSTSEIASVDNLVEQVRLVPTPQPEEIKTVEDKFRQEIEDNFHKDYAANRQIDPRTIDTFKELDKRRPQPIGEQEILIIADRVFDNCQKSENRIKEYEKFLEEQFSNNKYTIDDETRRQLCNRQVALGIEEETLVLLYNQLADKLYNQTQREEAISVLLEALRIMESAEIYWRLGRAFDKQGQQDAAINNFKQAQALFEEQKQYEQAQAIIDFLNSIL
jgi:tetratricopeptide (TPR) repeat protein